MKKKKQIKNVSPPLTLLDKIKNVFYFIGILGIGFLIIFCLAKIGHWTDKKEVEKIKEHKLVTIGTIIKVGNMKGNYAIAEYYVGTKRYERQDEPPSNGIYPGEHYEIFYDSIIPNESRIDYTRPVFLKTQQTGITNGTVDDFASWGRGCFFKYIVNGIEYSRVQKISEEKIVKEGETYSVDYLVSDPRIAILKIK